MTSKQFYIMLFVTTISLKVQKLPAILYDTLGKDGYLLLFCYFVVDLIGILLAFFVLKTLKNKKEFTSKQMGIVSLFAKILVLAIVVYFVVQGLLLYEAIQNLFEHILFDNLSWVLFGFLLLFSVTFLASTGIKNIARNFELYFVVIIFSYVVISIFGISKTDFSEILPFSTIDISKIFGRFVDFNLWFGDFFLVLFMGRNAENIKLKWTALIYTLSIFFIALLYVELNGIYGVYTSMKPSLISTITEQSMLGVGIGRVDWFLILITEIGTILSSGLCFYFACRCLKFVFPKIKQNYLLIFIAAVFYFVNVFYFVDMHQRINVFTGYLSVVSAATKWLTFLLILAVCVVDKIKNKIANNRKNLSKNLEKTENNNPKTPKLAEMQNESQRRTI